jgi:hypothetical protein
MATKRQEGVIMGIDIYNQGEPYETCAVSCDRCGEAMDVELPDSDGCLVQSFLGRETFKEPEDALATAQERGWLIDGNEAYCPECKHALEDGDE